MASHNNVEWFRGEDILITFTMVPTTDITGWNISCAVKKTLDMPTVALAIPATIANPTDGVFTVPVTAAQNTTVLGSGSYVYAVERVDSGSISVLSEGTILVKPSAKLA